VSTTVARYQHFNLGRKRLGRLPRLSLATRYVLSSALRMALSLPLGHIDKNRFRLSCCRSLLADKTKKGSPKFERAFDGIRWISSWPTKIAFHTIATLHFSSTGPRSRRCYLRRSRSSRAGLQSDKRLPKTPERRSRSRDIRGRRSCQRSRHSRSKATASTS
jgi:hypothetical protein